MIHDVDRRLCGWIGRFVQPVPVVLAAPAAMSGQTGVSLHLMELVPGSLPRGAHRAPLSATLRYLITAWLDDVPEGHRLLGELLFAAMDEQDLEVDPGPLSPAAWTALGVAPRPAVLLKVPVRKPRLEPVVPRVRGRVTVQFGGMRPLLGLVLGPGHVPIMAATVSLPALRLSSRTDARGRFRFAAVPEEPPLTEVRVNARGREVTWPIPAETGRSPLVIELTESQLL